MKTWSSLTFITTGLKPYIRNIKATGRWQIVKFDTKTLLYIEVDLRYPKDILEKRYDIFYNTIDFVSEEHLLLDVSWEYPIQECGK